MEKRGVIHFKNLSRYVHWPKTAILCLMVFGDHENERESERKRNKEILY